MPHEVKRAYRKLAMHWHPDRNAAPEAVDRFRQVRAAYDFLVEGARGEAGEGADEAAPPAEDEAAQAPDAPPAPGPDQRESLHLSIEEAVFGCEHAFTLGQVHSCDDCGGEGFVQLGRSRLCVECHGSGRIRTASGLDRCGICEGRGYVSKLTCESCDGSGQVQSVRRVRLKVPTLMWPGRVLRLAGKATPEGDRPAGDLLLVAQIEPHALFDMDGETLRFTMPVSAFSLLAGGELRVPVPGGEASVRLEAGRPEAQDVRLAGHGLPCRSGGRGDLVVTLQPAWPDALEAVDADALAQLSAHFTASADRLMPELAAWQSRWLGAAAPEASEASEAAETPRKKKGKKDRAEKGAKSEGAKKHKRKAE